MHEYIVICRADRTPDGAKGEYELATRRVFSNESEAKQYLAGVSESREPIVVTGDFRHLRFER